MEEIVSDPMSLKLKRGQKEKIESALSDAMAQLEVDEANSEDLRKKELALKRVVTKVGSLTAWLSCIDTDKLALGHGDPLSYDVVFEVFDVLLTRRLSNTYPRLADRLHGKRPKSRSWVGSWLLCN